MNAQMYDKWTPSTEDYKRLESLVIELLNKQNEQRKRTNSMIVIWLLTMVFIGFKVLFG